MGLFDILFGSADSHEIKPVIKKEPQKDIVEYFILKDKFQLSDHGTDNFYFVDDKLATHHLFNQYSNVYTWRSARIGDKIRQTRKFNTYSNGIDGCYASYLKYDVEEVSKYNGTGDLNGKV